MTRQNVPCTYRRIRKNGQDQKFLKLKLNLRSILTGLLEGRSSKSSPEQKFPPAPYKTATELASLDSKIFSSFRNADSSSAFKAFLFNGLLSPKIVIAL